MTKRKTETSKHKFPYEWNLSDGYPSPGIDYHGSKVFSCFACGGGSSMGYKLAGYDVLGYNEIDKRMAECYDINHNPKLRYVEPIQDFKLRKDLPQELYELDILDGSPPCSSFSMAGNREKDWGKDKKFREGQSKQVLDTLFFDFIDLAKELQPKIVVAENVKGLMQGEAKEYLYKIHDAFVDAGYKPCFHLLDASKMGVPQRRERVFFIAIRNDLADNLDYEDMFNEIPYIDLRFNEKKIPFKSIESLNEKPCFENPAPSCLDGWSKAKPGNSIYKDKKFDTYKIHPNKILNTITAQYSKGRGGALHYNKFRMLTPTEVFKASSFPLDYKCKDPLYICGMSVPPLMMAQIAHRIYEQWISDNKQIEYEKEYESEINHA